eukprot:UN09541
MLQRKVDINKIYKIIDDTYLIILALRYNPKILDLVYDEIYFEDDSDDYVGGVARAQTSANVQNFNFNVDIPYGSTKEYMTKLLRETVNNFKRHLTNFFEDATFAVSDRPNLNG